MKKINKKYVLIVLIVLIIFLIFGSVYFSYDFKYQTFEKDLFIQCLIAIFSFISLLGLVLVYLTFENQQELFDKSLVKENERNEINRVTDLVYKQIDLLYLQLSKIKLNESYNAGWDSFNKVSEIISKLHLIKNGLNSLEIHETNLGGLRKGIDNYLIIDCIQDYLLSALGLYFKNYNILRFLINNKYLENDRVFELNNIYIQNTKSGFLNDFKILKLLIEEIKSCLSEQGRSIKQLDEINNIINILDALISKEII